jgi:2-polyprenyl-6-hydroxyphenyl methylase/3-demethylubiquinone-9 3-methyltransferase
MPTALPRNDLRQYDQLAGHWWQPNGTFAMLHWIAQARAELIPPAPRPGAVLVDLGCGGGLLAPHAKRLGYHHVGVDMVESGLRVARHHGVQPVRGDAARVPLADGCAAAVSAGELLEHVTDPLAVVAEACRLLEPGGVLALDTINRTAAARFVTVTIGERLPGLAPKGIHDPNLFVPPAVLVNECASHGVMLTVRGLRPALASLARWYLTGRRGRPVPMRPTRSTAVLYQGFGRKKEDC